MRKKKRKKKRKKGWIPTVEGRRELGRPIQGGRETQQTLERGEKGVPSFSH